MITINTQLHGYRQGHQLLDSTISLSKCDQTAIDRLSDISGPLRPKERFEPYLSAYPLPEGQFYVFARTWQDFTVQRAGCVRTLSAIIRVCDWQDMRGFQALLDVLNPQSFPSHATSEELPEVSAVLLPQAPEFCASELIEALFFEDTKPIVVFDSPSPDLLAVRLLAALWPALRSRFALSTFALSPRKIDSRNFDLVFAPKDARARFADWPGRRIDVRSGIEARHRWTNEIAQRVFQSSEPWILNDREISLIGKTNIGTPAALRIILLWNELLDKLEESPSAALGLVDIANSKMQSHSAALRDLQPALATATQCAVDKLPDTEAWEFLSAMARKIFGTPLVSALPSVINAVTALTKRSPAGAIALLDHAGKGEAAIKEMLPAIAHGLTLSFGAAVAKALENARASTFKELILADPQLALASLANSTLIERLARVITGLQSPLFELLRDVIIPAIIDDAHAILARPLFSSLDVDGVLAEVKHLNKVNSFQSMSLLPPLIEQGRKLSAIEDIRDTLLSIAQSPGRDEFLRMTLSPVINDVWWLLRRTSLSKEATGVLLQGIVRQANTQQFQNLFGDISLAPILLEHFGGTRDILVRAVTEGKLSLSLRVPIVLQLLSDSIEPQRRELATDLMNDCLQEHFGDDELGTLSTLFVILEPLLDGNWVVRTGLDRSMPISVINRNIVAFHTSPHQARLHIVAAVEGLLEGLAARSPLNLNEEASAACAALLRDAQSVNFVGFLHGAGRLLSTLFHSERAPVSPIVVATFPAVYHELAKNDDVPDVLKFVPFIDWDRCKAARRQLVDTFLSSHVWRPVDLALTACLALDVEKILQRVAKSDHGDSYILRIAADIKMLPVPCQEVVRKAIKRIQSD